MGNKEILKRTTATNLMLRLFIGGFLIYMAYEILTTLQDATSGNKAVLIAFSIFFIISGAVIGAHSLYCLIKHKYYDPMTDQANESSKEAAEVYDSLENVDGMNDLPENVDESNAPSENADESNASSENADEPNDNIDETN